MALSPIVRRTGKVSARTQAPSSEEIGADECRGGRNVDACDWTEACQGREIRSAEDALAKKMTSARPDDVL